MWSLERRSTAPRNSMTVRNHRKLTLFTSTPQYSGLSCAANKLMPRVACVVPLPDTMHCGVRWSLAWTAPTKLWLRLTRIVMKPPLHVAVTVGWNSVSNNCPAACNQGERETGLYLTLDGLQSSHSRTEESSSRPRNGISMIVSASCSSSLSSGTPSWI